MGQLKLQQLGPTGQPFTYLYEGVAGKFSPAIGMRLPAIELTPGIMFFHFDKEDIAGLEEFVRRLKLYHEQQSLPSERGQGKRPPSDT